MTQLVPDTPRYVFEIPGSIESGPQGRSRAIAANEVVGPHSVQVEAPGPYRVVAHSRHVDWVDGKIFVGFFGPDGKFLAKLTGAYDTRGRATGARMLQDGGAVTLRLEPGTYVFRPSRDDFHYTTYGALDATKLAKEQQAQRDAQARITAAEAELEKARSR